MSDNKVFLSIVLLLLMAAGDAVASGDPTRPGRSYQGKFVKQAPTAGFQVSAIFINGSQPQAIINNRLISEGDRIAGALVKRITKGSVVINQQRDGNWQSVTLSVNKPPKNKFSIRSADKF